jgi:hypothetical protein
VSPIGGTQEAKRRSRAVPSATDSGTARGCLYVLLVHIMICSFWYLRSGSFFPVVVGVPAVVVLAFGFAYFLYGRLVLSRVAAEWAPRGVRCLLVHSNSRLWEGRIASHWLPRLGDRAVTLNWSERSTWPASLEVQVFKSFCSAQRNFNPAVVVFRGLREPLVFRFYHAFREASIGRSQYLDEQEKRLFDSLGV